MRILTWNINGIRTIPQYHPWNSLKTHDDILNYLEADIINFQEVKSTRSALSKGVAVPPSFDSFFSFPLQKSGYSGVATYTRTSVVVPSKAEEGLSFMCKSSTQLKPALDTSERVSKQEIYPDDHVVVIDADEEGIKPGYRSDGTLVLKNGLKQLDAEGRVLTLDFGMFVLINVYCPNDGSDERLPFKMDFHYVLEDRVRGLIREGREVIVVGDINACAALIDHCEGHLIIKRGIAEGKNGEDWFWEEKDGRQWLRDLLIHEGTEGSQGCLVDIVRQLHPDRKGMYTCWNTKISARESNYGTRIDYILITPGLVPWVKGADIQPHIKGSDHCPVYIDFHDEITLEDGRVLELKTLLSGGGDAKNNTPRIAAKFWDEYSGKQKLLSSFFGGKKAAVTTLATQPTSSTVVVEEIQTDVEVKPSLSSPTPNPTQQAPENASQSKKRPLSPPGSSSAPVKKSKSEGKKKPVEAKTKKMKPGQSKLSTFFAQPASSTAKGKGKEKKSEGSTAPVIDLDEQEDADYRLAVELSSRQVSSSSPSSSQKQQAGEAWKSLMAPIEPPRCTVHNEVTKEFTVNKPGANKGKKFFVCSRPVGPGYDKGPGERLREDVDPQYKCNFFRWSSDVRKDMIQKKGM